MKSVRSSKNLKKNFTRKCFKKNKIVRRGSKKVSRRFKIGRKKGKVKSSFADKTIRNSKISSRLSSQMLERAILGNE